MVYSDIVTLGGFDPGLPVTVTDAAYRIYASATSTWGDWTKAAGTVSPGDKVQLRTTTDTTVATDKTATLTTGDLTVDRKVSTAAADSVPDAISTSGGKYRVYSSESLGAWTADACVLTVGAKAQVRVRSSASRNDTTSATLTIGSVSDSFDVTTAP